MGKLRELDKKSAEKGTVMQTAWQFAKFVVVSLLASFVQFSLVNILPYIPAIRALYETEFHWFIFESPIIDGGLGFFIVFNVSNVAAQIVAFFVNKEKTFNSGANTAAVLPIYLLFTFGLLTFSAWFSPIVNGWIVNSLGWNDAAARNIATSVCATLQFFLYFPVDKVLFRKKKQQE